MEELIRKPGLKIITRSYNTRGNRNRVFLKVDQYIEDDTNPPICKQGKGEQFVLRAERDAKFLVEICYEIRYQGKYVFRLRRQRGIVSEIEKYTIDGVQHGHIYKIVKLIDLKKGEFCSFDMSDHRACNVSVSFRILEIPKLINLF